MPPPRVGYKAFDKSSAATPGRGWISQRLRRAPGSARLDVGPGAAQEQAVGRFLGNVEDLADEGDGARAAEVDRVADVQPGLAEEVGRGDDLAGTCEPPAADQLEPEPARVAVVTDERDRAEARHRDLALTEGDDALGVRVRGDGLCRCFRISGSIDELGPDGTRRAAVDLRNGAHERCVDAQRERHRRDPDEQRAKGHRRADWVGEAGRDAEPGGDPRGEPQPEPPQPAAVGPPGWTRPAADRPDRAHPSSANRRQDRRHE